MSILYDNINNFKIFDDKYLFFDIFARNNQIILICPSYININEYISIVYNDTLLPLVHIDGTNSAIYILYYSLLESLPTSSISCKVFYQDQYKEFNIEHVIFDIKRYTIIQTTLFKDDYFLLNMFTNYYKTKHGIEHFYMYYNDDINKIDMNNINNKDSITFIEWNYDYFYPSFPTHSAQPAQINHAFLKYGVVLSEYMLFNDLDEYIYINNTNNRIIDILSDISFKKYSLIVFHNNWCNTIDDKIPTNFPNKFLRQNIILPYHYRSKFICKTNDINIILSIHGCDYFTKQNAEVLDDNNYLLFHFFKWASNDFNRDKFIKNFTDTYEFELCI